MSKMSEAPPRDVPAPVVSPATPQPASPIRDHLSLLSHVAQKGVQAGSVLALALSPPYLVLRSPSALSFANVSAHARVGAVAGGLLAVLLGAARTAGLDPAGVADRAARLRANAAQHRCDVLAASGGAAGGMLAVLSAGRAGSVLGSAAVGVAVGVAAHVATARNGPAYRALDSAGDGDT
jgi:Protein of unknown function (DUF1757)